VSTEQGRHLPGDVQTWVNSLRTRCQSCAQGKDAARPTPVCCAVGKCCQQIHKDWTNRNARAVLRAALAEQSETS
jgi:hypothetical protein